MLRRSWRAAVRVRRVGEGDSRTIRSDELLCANEALNKIKVSSRSAYGFLGSFSFFLKIRVALSGKVR